MSSDKQGIKFRNGYRETAVDVMRAEAEGILFAAEQLGDAFDPIIEEMLECTGRVVMTGMGKSGIIARKIAATLASTGTPSFFLHPAEASHGDLGMVTSGDIVFLLSNSGESDELLRIMPSLKRIRCRLYLMTTRPKSSLARLCDRVLVFPELKESDLFELAPTVTTTAMLATGDAIAMVLVKERQFQSEQFALLHPAGSLGKKLIIQVRDLMKQQDEMPLVCRGCLLEEAIFEISQQGMGAAVIVDSLEERKILGILTDGDIRRILLKNRSIWELQVEQVMTSDPACVEEETLAVDALNMMESKKITVLPVRDSQGRVCGLIHMHQILQSGVV